jgi:curved DNA-binding protein CbpA
MVREHPDPYLVLGVSPTATQAEITHAYRTRLRAHHPDTRRPPASKTADDDLRQVLAAYGLLRDSARRLRPRNRPRRHTTTTQTKTADTC